MSRLILGHRTFKRFVIGFCVCLGFLLCCHYVIINHVHAYRLRSFRLLKRYQKDVLPLENHTSAATVPTKRFGFTSMYLAPAAKVRQPFLLVLVNSSPHDEEHRQRRQAIRDTWGRTCDKKIIIDARHMPGHKPVEMLSCAVVFFVGRTHDNDHNELMVQENEQHEDVIISDSLDNYYSITEKLLLSFKWAADLRPKFVLKTDDDVYVNLKRLATKLVFDTTLPYNLYGGVLYYGDVERDKASKHFVSREHFPQNWYPPYCKGSQFVFAGHLLAKFLQTSTTVPRLVIDDAYVGIVMWHIGVTAIHLPEFVQFKWMAYFVDHLSPCAYSHLITLGDSLSVAQMHAIQQYMTTYESTHPYCFHVDDRVTLLMIIMLSVSALVHAWRLMSRKHTEPVVQLVKCFI